MSVKGSSDVIGSLAPTLPEWQVSQWFNTDRPLRLSDLRGRVVLVHTFQMLCPGCVAHGLPLAAKVHEQFAEDGVAVIGLHTVFEHHEAMGPRALQAFIHEYGLRFPIGVDMPSSVGPVPRTMAQWRLRGTPSLLLLDTEGRLRLHRFGAVNPLQLGVALGHLLAEVRPPPPLTKPRQARPAPAPRACARPAAGGGNRPASPPAPRPRPGQRPARLLRTDGGMQRVDTLPRPAPRAPP